MTYTTDVTIKSWNANGLTCFSVSLNSDGHEVLAGAFRDDGRCAHVEAEERECWDYVATMVWRLGTMRLPADGAIRVAIAAANAAAAEFAKVYKADFE